MSSMDASLGQLLSLIDEHRRLRDVIAGLSARQWSGRVHGKRYSAAWMIRGIAAHDPYHAGQIQLLKRVRSRTLNQNPEP